MKGIRLLKLGFTVIMLSLLVILAWSFRAFYNLQLTQESDRVVHAIKEAAAKTTEANMILNNLAGAMSAGDLEVKTAFAAGATGNTGKMREWFDEDRHLSDQKIALQNKRAMTDTSVDTVIKVNKVFLQKRNVNYIPSAVKTIAHFDSLFKAALKNEKISIHYSIHKQSPDDTVFHNAAYNFSSPGFIINFYNPRIYRVDYTIATHSILMPMLPYIVAGILLPILLLLAFAYMLRAYRMQAQMHTFRESLFSNVTHELKTPLSSLQIIMETAQLEADKPMPANHLHFATSELMRMKLTVDKIISFGRMNSEQFELDKELLDVNEVIQTAIEVMQTLAVQYKGEVSFAGGDKILLVGDKTLLVNTISTLIDNALKYNNGNPRITISAITDSSMVTITVADNGIGIGPAYRKKIFEPFFRIPTGNKHNVKGHGLGLSFAAQVVAFHHGSITVSSTDEGSTFTIQIPIHNV